MITILRDEESFDTIYGVIVADDGIEIDDEIAKIKTDPEFIREFTDNDGVSCWCIDDVLEILFEKFPIEYESDYANAYI